MNINKGNIGNALHSVAPDHTVAVAADIYDEALNKYQSELNQQIGQGGYNPPQGGIPKSDLSSSVQASLDKADAAVPNTRTVNGKALSSDITLNASDVGALPSSTTIPTSLSQLNDDSTHRTVTDSEKTNWSDKYTKTEVDNLISSAVPDTRKVNGKALSSDITLNASDVSALPSSTPIPTSLSQLGDDSTHRTVTDSEKTNWSDKYTKTEVNNLISSAPESDVIVVEVPSGSDIATYLLNNVPAAQRPNNIFRVPGTTSYSEWAWNGTAFIHLDEKDYGIDDTLFENGTNLTTSKAVYKAVGEAFNVADTFIQLDGTPKTITGCGWACTDFIPVLPSAKCDVNVITNYTVSTLAFYDKKKNFISNIVVPGTEARVTYSNTISVPNDVYYVRCSAFHYGANLPHSLIIRQNEQIVDELQYQRSRVDDIAYTKRVINNAKLVNYQIVQNQDNWHIDVIPATFSKFTLSGPTHISDEYQDVVFAYNEELTELSGSFLLKDDTSSIDVYVPSTAKYILLTINEGNPGKISITDSISTIKRSSIAYTSSLQNAFVNSSGNVQTLTGRYYWHVERYDVSPFSQIKFNIPQENRTGALVIAFYSGEPSNATLLLGYTTNNEETKSFIVPYRAKYMLLSQYTALSAPITFHVEDFRDKEIETKQNTGVRLYKDESLVAALRWGDSYQNYHIVINGNEQAAIIDGISSTTPSLKSGYYFSSDIHFEKVNLTKNEFLILKAQCLIYPSTQNLTVIDITYVAGNINLVDNVNCYKESGTYTDIIHIVTSGSDYLTQCFVENVKIETLTPNSLDSRLFTELFDKRNAFVSVSNENFAPTSTMSLYKEYRARLLTYECSRQKEIVLNSDNIVRKPFNFNGKTACFCGDSITRGYTDGTTISENNYVKAFSDAVGLTYTNKAVGGATFAQVEGLTQIGTQVKSITDGQYDFIFIAGGVNDYARSVDFSTFKTTLEDLCDWINTNLSSANIIWITPINHAFDEGTGYLMNTYALWQYISIMTEVLIRKDSLSRYSIVKGHKFNFPVYGMDDDYIAAAFGDRLHPSLLGYQNIYAPGLLNALCCGNDSAESSSSKKTIINPNELMEIDGSLTETGEIDSRGGLHNEGHSRYIDVHAYSHINAVFQGPGIGGENFNHAILFFDFNKQFIHGYDADTFTSNCTFSVDVPNGAFWMVTNAYRNGVNGAVASSYECVCITKAQELAIDVLYSKKFDSIRDYDFVNTEAADFTQDGLLVSRSTPIIFNRFYSIATRKIKYVCKFGSDTVAKFSFHNYLSNAQDNPIVTVNMSAKTIALANITQQASFLDSSHIYEIEIIKDFNLQKAIITDIDTSDTISLEHTNSGSGGTGQGSVAPSDKIGDQWDYYSFYKQSGANFVVKNMSISALHHNVKLLMYGDSITDPESYYPASMLDDSWTHLIMNSVNGNVMTSGRSSSRVYEIEERIKNELPYIKADYVMITIGTNGGNTVDNLSRVVETIISNGSTPLLNHIPCNEHNTQVAVNAIIDTVRNKYGISGANFDIPTSINGDGTEVDTSKMWWENYSDGDYYHHPNVAGAKSMFVQARIDVPELFV